MRIASPKQYRTSALINLALGVLLLLLASGGAVLEALHPDLRGSGLVWGFGVAAAICLFVGVLHWRRYRRS